MKKKSLFLYVLLLLFSSKLRSQSDETENSQFKFGAGIAIDLTEQQYYPLFSTPNIVLSFEFQEKFRIEPGFGFNSQFRNVNENSDGYSSDSKGNLLSLGNYWIITSGSISPHLGLYIDHAWSSYVNEDTSFPSEHSEKQLRIGPSLGIDYEISDHFQIGGEFLLLRKKGKVINESLSENNSRETNFYGWMTGTRFWIRFYL